MIIKIQFSGEKEEHTMLFGDSYKPWQRQYEEYMRLNADDFVPVKAWSCPDKWVSYGGLKWCLESEFQDELDLESADKSAEFKLRWYRDMKFTPLALSKLPSYERNR